MIFTTVRDRRFYSYKFNGNKNWRLAHQPDAPHHQPSNYNIVLVVVVVVVVGNSNATAQTEELFSHFNLTWSSIHLQKQILIFCIH